MTEGTFIHSKGIYDKIWIQEPARDSPWAKSRLPPQVLLKHIVGQCSALAPWWPNHSWPNFGRTLRDLPNHGAWEDSEELLQGCFPPTTLCPGGCHKIISHRLPASDEVEGLLPPTLTPTTVQLQAWGL